MKLTVLFFQSLHAGIRCPQRPKFKFEQNPFEGNENIADFKSMPNIEIGTNL